METPRNEYPRPDFIRGDWKNLNGEWEFSFDTDDFDKRITVPFVYQAELSGIGSREGHETVWYRKDFYYEESKKEKRILLHFGAVDYYCKVWVNNTYVGDHTGGHISFTIDVTDAVRQGNNTLKLQVKDEIRDMEMPRGKQYWKDDSESIFYTRTTGIWQTVWLETVHKTHLERVLFTPDLDEMAVELQYEVADYEDTELEVEIYKDDICVVKTQIQVLRGSGSQKFHIDQQILNQWNFQEDVVWSPENPNLFDVILTLKKNRMITDCVKSYFGMRKVSIENGIFLLNNHPYYQKLLLDQGYWREGLLTVPTDSDFVKDIKLAKEMGFNGVRKHQKIEDPRFLYHADRMGFLVWGEIAAAYVYSRKYVRRITEEWMDEIIRDYNHPSIVAWTPLNESWGVPNIKDIKAQQSHSAAMVHLTKSLDSTRPVISNDGWEHTCTDILTLHDYEADREVLEKRYGDMEEILNSRPSQRALFAHEWQYTGQPVMVTEFGGISYKKDEQEGWGYSSAASDEDFEKRYADVVEPLLRSPHVQGFCYTQITDVEQEINGLCTYDRVPKINPEKIRRINEGKK